MVAENLKYKTVRRFFPTPAWWLISRRNYRERRRNAIPLNLIAALRIIVTKRIGFDTIMPAFETTRFGCNEKIASVLTCDNKLTESLRRIVHICCVQVRHSLFIQEKFERNLNFGKGKVLNIHEL